MKAVWATMLMLFVCCCVSEKPKAREAVVEPTVYFREDFSNGLGNWSVRTTGGATVGVVSLKALGADESLQILSSGLRGATAQAPEFRMDFTRPYTVSFDFMLMHRDNLGLGVYRDPNVRLVLGQATGLECESGGKRTLLGRFDTNAWTRVTVEVRPDIGEYDVLLGKERKAACSLERSAVKSFVVGDEDPMDAAYGDALWDNFRIEGR